MGRDHRVPKIGLAMRPIFRRHLVGAEAGVERGHFFARLCLGLAGSHVLRGDDGLDRFPFVRRRGDVALIAVSTGVPTAPFLATGRLGQRQLARLAEALEQTRESFRIVLIHHPPLSLVRRYFLRLVDGPDLRRVLAATGAELLLHGHDHRRSLVWLEGADNKKIPAVGVASASAYAKYANEDPAGYNLFRIEGAPGNWKCETVSYQRDDDGAIRECARFRIY